MFNTLKKVLVMVLIMLTIACSHSQHSESTGEYFDSAAITMKVKASLVDQLGTSGFAVVVKTYKDQVILSGFVDTLAIKQQAARITAGVDGVGSVRNALVVKPS